MMDSDSDAKERMLQESILGHSFPCLDRAGSGAGCKILETMERASRQVACEQLVSDHD
jgi:hypothetical protein